MLLLANHYLQKFARSMGRDVKHLAADAVHALNSYDWPGNVRELEHAIEHAMVLSQREVIGASDLPFARHAGQPSALRNPAGPFRPEVERTAVHNGEPREKDAAGGPAPSVPAVSAEVVDLPYAEAKKRIVASFDDAYTTELLRRTGGNMSEAARRAGLDRSNFRRLLKRSKDDD